ncbi:hypothetical protein E4099_14300, partial [Streptomyces palmae]
MHHQWQGVPPPGASGSGRPGGPPGPVPSGGRPAGRPGDRVGRRDRFVQGLGRMAWVVRPVPDGVHSAGAERVVGRPPDRHPASMRTSSGPAEPGPTPARPVAEAPPVVAVTGAVPVEVAEPGPAPARPVAEESPA